MRILFWFVFCVGVIAITTTVFRVVWSLMAIPVMVFGVVFGFVFGIMPILLIVALALLVARWCGLVPGRRCRRRPWWRIPPKWRGWRV